MRAAAPGSASKVLLQLSTNSYAAYNNWGGFSVYGYHGINGVQGHRASFDRPMGTGLYYSWEHFFVVWAEGNGETPPRATTLSLLPAVLNSACRARAQATPWITR